MHTSSDLSQTNFCKTTVAAQYTLLNSLQFIDDEYMIMCMGCALINTSRFTWKYPNVMKKVNTSSGCTSVPVSAEGATVSASTSHSSCATYLLHIGSLSYVFITKTCQINIQSYLIYLKSIEKGQKKAFWWTVSIALSQDCVITEAMRSASFYKLFFCSYTVILQEILLIFFVKGNAIDTLVHYKQNWVTTPHCNHWCPNFKGHFTHRYYYTYFLVYLKCKLTLLTSLSGCWDISCFCCVKEATFVKLNNILFQETLIS